MAATMRQVDATEKMIQLDATHKTSVFPVFLGARCHKVSREQAAVTGKLRPVFSKTGRGKETLLRPCCDWFVIVVYCLSNWSSEYQADTNPRLGRGNLSMGSAAWMPLHDLAPLSQLYRVLLRTYIDSPQQAPSDDSCSSGQPEGF